MIRILIAVGLFFVFVPVGQAANTLRGLLHWLKAVRDITSNLPKIGN
ncbi:MAG: hypothetical protein JXA10_10385 [Anaerolineae bacterium]|nr:hypothetical protein [Anaerolineae bacterium]